METTLAKTDRLHLSDLNKSFIHNFVTSDVASHDKIIHEDFICIESSGKIVDRNEYLEEWAHGYKNSGYTAFSMGEEEIRIFNEMALVRAKTTYSKVVNGNIIRGHSIYTDTYVKVNGKWLCVQAQITAVI